MFESSLALVAAQKCSRQIRFKKAGWMCKVVSGMFILDSWWGMDWRAKVLGQNCGRALVELKKKKKNNTGAF